MAPTLQDSVIVQIFSYIPQSWLDNSRCVSKAFSVLLKPLNFNHVTIRAKYCEEYNMDGGYSEDQMKMLLKLEVAKYIQRLTLRSDCHIPRAFKGPQKSADYEESDYDDESYAEEHYEWEGQAEMIEKLKEFQNEVANRYPSGASESESTKLYLSYFPELDEDEEELEQRRNPPDLIKRTKLDLQSHGASFMQHFLPIFFSCHSHLIEINIEAIDYPGYHEFWDELLMKLLSTSLSIFNTPALCSMSLETLNPCCLEYFLFAEDQAMQPIINISQSAQSLYQIESKSVESLVELAIRISGGYPHIHPSLSQIKTFKLTVLKNEYKRNSGDVPKQTTQNSLTKIAQHYLPTMKSLKDLRLKLYLHDDFNLDFPRQLLNLDRLSITKTIFTKDSLISIVQKSPSIKLPNLHSCILDEGSQWSQVFDACTQHLGLLTDFQFSNLSYHVLINTEVPLYHLHDEYYEESSSPLLSEKVEDYTAFSRLLDNVLKRRASKDLPPLTRLCNFYKEKRCLQPASQEDWDSISILPNEAELDRQYPW